jgi:hypothetical protein
MNLKKINYGKIFSNIIFPHQKCTLQIGEDFNDDD